MAHDAQALRHARLDLGAVFGAVIKRLPRIVLLTLVLLSTAFVLLLLVPRQYESAAGILVEPRDTIQSQIALIQSRETLLSAVDQLDLRSVPEFNGSASAPSPLGIIAQFLGRKTAPSSLDEAVLANLLDRMTVTQGSDSAIITVQVRSTDPELAAEIANAIADAHVRRPADAAPSDDIAKLRAAVTTAEKAVAAFRAQHGSSLADLEQSSTASQIAQAQERKNAAQSRAALIRGLLQRGAPIDGVADVRASAVIQQLTQEKARLQGEQAQKAATLLPNHPTIQALVAQINALNNQINLEGRRVAEGLESEAEVEAGLEASLRAELARAEGAVAASPDTATLATLEREAKTQRDLLDSALQRSGAAGAAQPDMQIVALATPSASPVSPNIPLILLAVGLAAAALQIALVLLGEVRSGRALAAARQAESEAARQNVRPQDELEAVPFMETELEPDQRWDGEAFPESEIAILDDTVVHNFDDPADWDEELVASETDAESRSRFIKAILAEPDTAPVTSAEDDSAFIAALAPQPAPIARAAPPPAPAAAPVQSRPHPVHTAFADLSADLALGRTRLVMLAGHRSNIACETLAEALVADALDRGLSVALVDAGSARRSDAAGLSDLSTEEASFGDVVHKSSDSSFAEVPWGQGASIDRHSPKPLTLIEALGDIYEVVVLMTGRVGMTSTLPLFADLDGRLVLVTNDDDDLSEIEDLRQQLTDAGFGRADIVTTPDLVAA